MSEYTMKASHDMYCIWRKDPETGKVQYVAKNGKTWTYSPNEARWYAYFRHAYTLREFKFPGASIAKYARNFDLCPMGGQK